MDLYCPSCGAHANLHITWDMVAQELTKETIVERYKQEAVQILVDCFPRIQNAVARAYMGGQLKKSLTKVSDNEILSLRHIGIKGLSQIRTALLQGGHDG